MLVVPDGQRGRLTFVPNKDADGITAVPGAITWSSDQPAIAALTPDPAKPLDVLIERIPATDPTTADANATIVVNVTGEDTTNDVTASGYQVQLVPGAETSAVISGTVEAIPSTSPVEPTLADKSGADDANAIGA